MKRLRVKKEFGLWYYRKVYLNSFDGPIYLLYDFNTVYVGTFAYFNDMRYYIYRGITL